MGIRDAEKQRAMRFVISTRDGATVEALENMTISVGGMTMTSAWHIWRDDQPPLLPAPPAWSAAAPDGQGPTRNRRQADKLAANAGGDRSGVRLALGRGVELGVLMQGPRCPEWSARHNASAARRRAPAA